MQRLCVFLVPAGKGLIPISKHRWWDESWGLLYMAALATHSFMWCLFSCHFSSPLFRTHLLLTWALFTWYQHIESSSLWTIILWMCSIEAGWQNPVIMISFNHVSVHKIDSFDLLAFLRRRLGWWQTCEIQKKIDWPKKKKWRKLGTLPRPEANSHTQSSWQGFKSLDLSLNVICNLLLS